MYNTGFAQGSVTYMKPLVFCSNRCIETHPNAKPKIECFPLITYL